jgi:release factor glutamine methyltransferase
MESAPSRQTETATPTAETTSAVGTGNPANAPRWSDLYDDARQRLRNDAEARWLVEDASGRSWSELVSEDPRPTGPALTRLRSMLDRRCAGEPLQYVLGHWSFRTLDLMVDRRVLIPRPETEHVVEVALAQLDVIRQREPDRHLVAVDLGTGSGAIALSIAAERQRVRVWATDQSRAALEVASANLAGLGGHRATRVRVGQGSWWSALPSELKGQVDLVVSNPPYVSSGEMPSLDPTVRDWEPPHALEAGPTGTEAIELILAGAGEWMRPGAAAVIEIAPHQADAAKGIARLNGFTEARVERDLAGRDRALVATRATTESISG